MLDYDSNKVFDIKIASLELGGVFLVPSLDLGCKIKLIMVKQR